MTKLIRLIASIPIYFYRTCLKPFLPQSCAFTPTCSQYALEAIKTHGVFKGWYLASWRILRCNPFNKNGHGYDPVPPRKSKQEKQLHYADTIYATKSRSQ